jgi:P-type Ca2+ transporter type 2C
MSLQPRKRNIGLFAQDELLISIIQGLLITTGVLWLDYFSTYMGASLNEARTMVFTTLIISNIFLTFTNRSFTENFIKTIRYKNNLAPWILIISVLFLFVLHSVPPVREIFGLAPVSFTSYILCTGVALITVAWFELYKTHMYKPDMPRITRHRDNPPFN